MEIKPIVYVYFDSKSINIFFVLKAKKDKTY